MDSGSRGWRRLGRALASSMAGVVVVVAAAIAFGGPGEPAPMASINDPFRAVDFSAVPPMRVVRARDGAPLAFHAYPAAAGSAARGSVVLVHGSSAQGRSLHPLAQGFANADYEVLALDIRGHGGSGTAGGGKGRIAYVGQLEDDLEDVMNAMAPPAPVVLAGFSSGGGFALRVAGGDERRRRFAGFLLLAPFLGPDAPTYRPNSGGWVSVGLPRYIALDLLDRAGLPWFQQLPVLRFALDAKAREFPGVRVRAGAQLRAAPRLARRHPRHRPTAAAAGRDRRRGLPRRALCRGLRGRRAAGAGDAAAGHRAHRPDAGAGGDRGGGGGGRADRPTPLDVGGRRAN